MTLTPHLASDSAACCWIPLFALRSELARRPELASLPVALVAPDTARPPRVWQVAPLVTVSPVVEPVELGRAYVGTDGLEGLYGGPEEIVEMIKRGMRNAERGTDEESSLACSAFPLPRSAFRVGWGRGKFVSWVAA